MNEAIADFCVRVYTFLLPISWIGAAVVVFILLPMTFFKTTRSSAGRCMFITSYLFGVTTWFLAAAVTFVTWGWIGLLVGIIIAGVGVVPIGVLAAFISLNEPALGFSLILMIVIVFATRMGGLTLAQSEISEQ